MAHIDRVKEEIGWLKVVFAILLAADISLVAWGVQNYGRTSPLLLTIGVIAAFLVTLAIIWINSIAYRKINKLEDL
ncbi:MAG: hypothetical protein OXG97_11995 [Candidatus Poribacteria bacterium]|nr:hypothetical protein [Candidatus Poribacteria bacterium]